VKHALVESIPGKVSVAWISRRPGWPVSVIFENIEAGANIDEHLMEWFDGLDREQARL